MNVLLLLIGLRPWAVPSSTSLLTRIFVAISVFSIEMQLVTWLHVGGLGSLRWVNAVLAMVALTAGPSLRWRVFGWLALRGTTVTDAPWWIDARNDAVPFYRAVPWPAALLLTTVVVALALLRPLEAADPYHFDKVSHIEQTGTLAYDVAADKKVNLLSSVYELVLADVRQIPLVGRGLERLHGLLELTLYLIAIASVRELLKGDAGWQWAAMLAVPVVFNQLVLVKNDLFVGVPALVVLAWVVSRSPFAPFAEIVWASWLAALVTAIKLTNLPVLLVLGGGVLLARPGQWRRTIGLLSVGTLLGILSGTLIFIVIENLRWYGDVMPVADISSRYAGLQDRATGFARFGISLIDLGQLTRRMWPGRGGWGGTFGLPLIWSLVLLAASARREREVQRTLVCVGLCFLVFAATFPDADLAQRLAMGPGLLAIAVGVRTVTGGGAPAFQWRRAGLAIATVLSATQIARSAYLYLGR